MIDQVKIDAFIKQLKELVETDQANEQNIALLYENNPEIKIGIRRAILHVHEKIADERRQVFYESGLPKDKNWPWFAIDNDGIVDTSSGEQYQVKKSDGEYRVIEL